MGGKIEFSYVAYLADVAPHELGCPHGATSPKKCEYFDICHGGCMHDGFLVNNDFKTKTFLCGAYKMIFEHISKRLEETGLGTRLCACAGVTIGCKEKTYLVN